ncbi:MAG: hypothetical protein ABIK18_04800, partial [candidate division WOR-3 bacterium]
MLKAVKTAGLLLLVATFALAATPEEDEAALTHNDIREPLVPVTGKPVPPGVASILKQNSACGPIWETDVQWDSDIRLTSNIADDWTDNSKQSVCVDPAGRIHVVWYSYREQPVSLTPQIFYKRYNPGSGWTSDTCISGDVANILSCRAP